MTIFPGISLNLEGLLVVMLDIDRVEYLIDVVTIFRDRSYHVV